MSFHLAFEANHGFAIITHDRFGPRVGCADPYLTFQFRTQHHQRVIFIIDIINEPLIAQDDFWTVAEDNLELLEIRRDTAPRFRAFKIVNFLLIDINLEGLLDAFVAESVATMSQGVTTILIQEFKAYLAYRLVYSIFPQ